MLDLWGNMLTTETSNSSHTGSSFNADFVARGWLSNQLALLDIDCSSVMIYRRCSVFILTI